MAAKKPRADETPDEPEVDVLGQLTIQLDAEYILRPSRQAISEIERLTGKPLIALASQCAALALPFTDVGICVAELMKAYGTANPKAGSSYNAAQPEICADLVFEHEPMKVQNRLAAIFRGALTGGYTAAGEPRAAGTKTTTEPTPTAD